MTLTYPAPVSLAPGTVSSGNGASADGSIIVGAIGGFAVRWSKGNSAALPNLPGTSASVANGCSADGSVIVGSCTVAGNPFPVRWSGGSVTQLAGLGGGDDTGIAHACSSDGSIIVGGATVALQGVVWTAGVIAALPSFPVTSSLPNAVLSCNDNGSIVPGTTSNVAAVVAAVWVNQIISQLSAPSDPALLTYAATAVSGDGNVFAGTSAVSSGTANGYIWQGIGGGAAVLPVSLGAHQASPQGVSHDGAVICGVVVDASSLPKPTVWQAGSFTTLALLPGAAVAVGVALGISRDGSTVVGYSFDGSGNPSAVSWGAPALIAQQVITITSAINLPCIPCVTTRGKIVF